MNEKYSINIFDFSPSSISLNEFDVTSCFKAKDKIQFAIPFRRPQDLS